MALASAEAPLTSSSDPLALLREFTTKGKSITRQGDFILFGHVRFARSAPTAYRERVKGEFYPTESLWFFLQNLGDSHAEYVRKCGQENIKAVSLPDKATLKQYLQGAIDRCPSVDYANYVPPPQPPPVGEDQVAELGKEEEEAAVVDDEAEQRRKEAEAIKLRELQESAEAFGKLLHCPTGARGNGKGVDSLGATELGQLVQQAKLFIREDREKTKQILKREKRLRSRKSILLSQSMPNFPLIAQILDGFKKRNERALAEDKRKQAERTRGGNARLAQKPGVPPGTALKPGQPSGGRGGGELPPSGTVGIIIVPAAVTAMVNMWNVKELLEEAKFTPALEKKQGGKQKAATLEVSHTFEDGSVARFLVTDSPLKLPATALGGDHWSNVAAAFVQGQNWQFKGWPMKSVVEIFEQIAGYYIRFADEVPNQTVKQWACTKLAFSKQRSKAHEVGVLMASFWASLHTFLSKSKPHLLQRESNVSMIS